MCKTNLVHLYSLRAFWQRYPKTLYCIFHNWIQLVVLKIALKFIMCAKTTIQVYYKPCQVELSNGIKIMTSECIAMDISMLHTKPTRTILPLYFYFLRPYLLNWDKAIILRLLKMSTKVHWVKYVVEPKDK